MSLGVSVWKEQGRGLQVGGRGSGISISVTTGRALFSMKAGVRKKKTQSPARFKIWD